VRAILLTGRVGSGKTAVLLELGRLLEERGEPYALLDLDWLAWVRPAPGTLTVEGVLLTNLVAVRDTFARAGVEWLVLARYLESAEQLAALRQILGDVFAVRLEVSRPELERRLRARDTRPDLDEHLALLDREDAFYEDLLLANDGGSPAETASAIYALTSPTGQDTPVPPSPQ
jgi:hypothetical protein